MQGNHVGPIAFSADGTLFEASVPGFGIKAWDVNSGHVALSLEIDERKRMDDAAGRNGTWLCVDGRHLMLTVKHAQLRRHALKDGAVEPFLPIRPEFPVQTLWAVAVSPHGERFVTGSYEGDVRVWEFKTGELIGTGKVRTNDDGGDVRNPCAPRLLTFSPDGFRFVWGTEGGVVQVWDARDCGLLENFQGPRGRVVAAAFLGDRLRVVSGAFQRVKFERDSKTGVLRREPLVIWDAEIGPLKAEAHP